MKNFIKNYKMSFMLLIAILIGGIVGVVMGPKAAVLEPFGQIFLNLMFTLIVPVVFFSVSSSIANMSGMNRLGKIMISIVVIFMITALLSGILSILGVFVFNPTKGLGTEAINNILSGSGKDIVEEANNLSLPQQLVKTITVNDFVGLFSRTNMLQLIIFAILFGISTALVGEKATLVKAF